MTMREQALSLARQGFRIFPIRAGEKKPPLVPSWQNVATSDEAQITAWWTRWPEANPGIHADDLLVLDVDQKKDGYESLAAFEQEVQLDATLEVETPSGGRHIYYRCTETIRNGVDVLGPGLDIRTHAGYVLGPGSRTAAGEYTVVVDEPIADAPPDLVARCKPVEPPPAARAEAPVSTDETAAVARAVDFLRTHPAAVEGQGGDHHTFRTACRIRDFGVPQHRALEALADWNERCVPPWEEADLAVKVENAYAYAQDAAGKLTPEALGFDVVQDPAAFTEREQTEKLSRANLMHPADVSENDVLTSEYLIKGVLEKQSNAVLFGHWNVGKTFVVLDMAACIASGLPWFGRRVRQGKVLYIGYEGLRAMRKRLLALREKYPALRDTTTPFRYDGIINPLTTAEGVAELGAALVEFTALHGGPPDLIINPLTTAEGVAELGAALVEFAALHGGPPDLIIIDTLAAALGGDDSDATLMSELNRCVATLMKRQRCTVLRVHHSGHGNTDRARGHSSLPAGIDTEIRVDEQEIALTKQRDDVRSKAFFKLKVVKLGRDSDGDEVTTCIIEQIEDNALSPELTGPQRELLDNLVQLRGDTGTVSKTDMRDCMPEGTTAPQKRELIGVLVKKQYLREEGKTWIISERGPLGIFD